MSIPTELINYDNTDYQVTLAGKTSSKTEQFFIFINEVKYLIFINYILTDDGKEKKSFMAKRFFDQQTDAMKDFPKQIWLKVQEMCSTAEGLREPGISFFTLSEEENAQVQARNSQNCPTCKENQSFTISA